MMVDYPGCLKNSNPARSTHKVACGEGHIHQGRGFGDGEGCRPRERLNEEVSRSHSGNLNFGWNHPTSCSWSERPHPNCHCF